MKMVLLLRNCLRCIKISRWQYFSVRMRMIPFGEEINERIWDLKRNFCPCLHLRLGGQKHKLLE